MVGSVNQTPSHPLAAAIARDEVLAPTEAATENPASRQAVDARPTPESTAQIGATPTR